MDTLFMNSENSKTSDPHRLLINRTDKIDLKRSYRYVALSNLSMYNMKKFYKNNKFKISVPKWNGEFDIPDVSNSVSDVQDYFEYILKKHETVTDNPSMMIYVNKVEYRITFKIKAESYLKLSTPGTMKLLGSTKSKISKDENGEIMSHLEITEVILVHFNIVNNDYQQDSRVLYTFAPYKAFGQLLDISTKHFIFLKTFNSEFSYIEYGLLIKILNL